MRPSFREPLGRTEGDVQLDVVLHRAAVTVVTVRKPDGQPAGNADVGLVSPGARLWLGQGGFNRQNVQTCGALRAQMLMGHFNCHLMKA